MTQVNIPYEFLVRWDYQTGALKGAYVRVYTATKDAAGIILSGKEGDAQPVAVAGALGFPLIDILTAIQSGAIIAMDDAIAAKAAAETALTQALAEIDTLKDSIAAKLTV